MKKIILIYLFVTVSNFLISQNQITRQQIMDNAATYANLVWTMHANNMQNACYSPTYISTNFSDGEVVTGMAYCWGGGHTIQQFLTGISGTGKAGNICTSSSGNPGYSPNTYGVDCSGFITRIWERPEGHLGTYQLENISTQINEINLEQGDILNDAGSHVALFSCWSNASTDSPNIIDASASGWIVQERTWANFIGYTPRRYNLIIEDFTISGNVVDGNGNSVSGVAINLSNNGGSTVTSNLGVYSILVNSGWTGTITPQLTGSNFTPATITVTNITADLSNQNFTANSITAAFSATPQNPTEGGSVTFTDQSTGSPISWLWQFPGGTPSSSTQQNPQITYNTQGTYNVTLTTTNSYGSDDSEVKNNYITVNLQAPVANFTYDPSNPYVNDIVNFEDKSTNSPESWSWNFGDGYTSTSQNPTHIYVNTGSYTVSLTTTNVTGTSPPKTKIINVTPPGILVSGRVISDSYVGLSGIPISTNLGSSTLSGYNGNFTITVPYNTSFILYIDGGQQYTSPVPVSYTYSQNTNIGDIMLWPITLYIQKTLIGGAGTFYKFSAENVPIGTTDYKWYLNGELKQESTFRSYYVYLSCNSSITIGLQVTGSDTYDANDITFIIPPCPNVTSVVTYDVNNNCSSVRVGQEVTIIDLSYPWSDMSKLNVWWSDGSGEDWCISSSCASNPDNSVYTANCRKFTHTFLTQGHYAAAVTAYNSVGNSTGTVYAGFNVVNCNTSITNSDIKSNTVKDNWNGIYHFWAGEFNLSGFAPKYNNYVEPYPENNIQVGACSQIVLNPGVTIAPDPGKEVVFYIDECLQTGSSKTPELIDTYTSFEDYCITEMLQKSVDVNKKEEETNSEYKILIFPNPNNGKFFIDISNNDYTITKMEIYNSLGQLMMEKLNVNKNRYNVDISTQPYGFYYLKVYSEDKIETFKIIYTTNQ